MLDLGWTELLLIGIVALIVVGPKELPMMFRTLGKFTARLRAMARDFSRAMEEAADEAGVKDVAKDLRKATNPKAMGLDALKDAVDFDEIDPFGENDDKDATSKSGASASGPETQPLSEERAEAAQKIRESAAAKATARLEAEAAARAEAESQSAPEPSEASDADPSKA